MTVDFDFDDMPEPEVGFVTFGLQLNDFRESAGVQVVLENGVLNDIAQDHAEDQVLNGYVSHTDLSGGTAGDRAIAAGYNYEVLAENIAQGFVAEDEVLDAWMASPGHRANILDARVDEFGVGREETTWVLLLGSQFE